MRCSGGSALLADARKHRAAIPGVFAVAGFLALWLGSVPYTVGGLFFAMRVASPTLALGAIVAGVVIARRPAPGLHPALLGLFLFATPPLTLLQPQTPAHTPLRNWLAFRTRVASETAGFVFLSVEAPSP